MKLPEPTPFILNNLNFLEIVGSLNTSGRMKELLDQPPNHSLLFRFLIFP